MSEKSIAEIEADLRHIAKIHEGRVRHECIIEAADRLHELDALRPLDESGQPVSIEQLAATWRAVHGYHVVGRIPPTIGQEVYADGWTDAFAYLRAVKR